MSEIGETNCKTNNRSFKSESEVNEIINPSISWLQYFDIYYCVAIRGLVNCYTRAIRATTQWI